jgi:hypothetical protein
MFISTFRKNRMGLLATMAALSLLAACGGGEDGGDNNSSVSSTGNSGGNAGSTLVCIAYLLVSGNDECLGYSSSSSSSLGGFSSGGRYVVNHDFEPNNDWMNSNQLFIEHTTSPDGFVIDGDINDVSDVADSFTFARKTGRNFRFKLCAPGQFQCNEYGEVDTLTAYIDILDSNGSVLVSSQAATRNFVSTRIDAGVTYYVRVAAGDTMTSTVAYQLMAQEFEPE